MADQQQLKLLTTHVSAWNQWREQNPEIIPDLQGANLRNFNLKGVNLIKANLENANFYGANLSEASFSQANLRGSDFTSANCFKAIFDEADVSYSYLTQADFSKAYLVKANLKGVYLIDAYLVEANLKDANLNEADLSNAYLIGANLTGTKCHATIFSGADLTAAKGLHITTEAQILTDIHQVQATPKQFTQDKSVSHQTLREEMDALRLENTKLKVQLYELYEEHSRLINQVSEGKIGNKLRHSSQEEEKRRYIHL